MDSELKPGDEIWECDLRGRISKMYFVCRSANGVKDVKHDWGWITYNHESAIKGFIEENVNYTAVNHISDSCRTESEALRKSRRELEQLIAVNDRRQLDLKRKNLGLPPQDWFDWVSYRK